MSKVIAFPVLQNQSPNLELLRSEQIAAYLSRHPERAEMMSLQIQLATKAGRLFEDLVRDIYAELAN